MNTDRARVMRHDGFLLLVLGDGGAKALPFRRGLEVVPGDWAVISDGTVIDVEPRRGLLRRRDSGGDEQLLAANVDVVAAVCGLDRPVRSGRLQRIAALAADADAELIVVLTKADLADDAAASAADAAVAVPGVAVHVVSTTSGDGIAELRSALADCSVVLVGESGAGKSTLVNALVQEDVAAIGDVRKGDAKGRHTTTSRQLHQLPSGGVILDSPGIRSVGLWVDDDAVDAVFTDIDDLAADCRFRDCTHDQEPGCAVRESVDPSRLDAWRQLRNEVAALERTEHERRRDGRRGGRMSREAQRFKRRD